jgi:hypothetical protein
MKIDWQAVAVVVALIMTCLGWGVSVEVRMAHYSSLQEIQNRLEVIEKNLQELLVDMKVREELEKKGIVGLPVIPAPKPDEALPDVNQIRNDLQSSAKKWAESQLRVKK